MPPQASPYLGQDTLALSSGPAQYANLLAGLDALTSTSGVPETAQPALPPPQSYFISQLYDPRFNPEAPATTADCGPTSLAMVLRAFGKAPSAANPEDLIQQVRYTMTGADNHYSDTTPDQILSAAQRYGLSGTRVDSLAQVESAVQQGKLVVLAGNPAAYNTGLSSGQYYPFSGGHFIVVTGINGDTATINDPLSHVGSLTISTAQLQHYMAYKGWNSGIALGT